MKIIAETDKYYALYHKNKGVFRFLRKKDDKVSMLEVGFHAENTRDYVLNNSNDKIDRLADNYNFTK